MRLVLLTLCMLLCLPLNVQASETRYVTQEEFLNYANNICDKYQYDLDKFVLLAMCERESSMNSLAINGQCKGLMQVSEKWHADRMKKLSVDDLMEPYGNILVACDYLSQLSEENDDIYYVLMRYNMKRATADKLYKEGKISSYASGIVSRAEELKKMAVNEELAKKEYEYCLFPEAGIVSWMK